MKFLIVILIGFLAASKLNAEQINAKQINVKQNDFHYLTSIDNTQYHLLHSKKLNHDYHIYVKTPKNIINTTDQKYPTIYLLDGGITYPLLSAYYRYLQLAKELPDAIIVGISYGTDDWKKGNKRSTDFTAAAKNRDHYGGALAFQSFLNDELFPLIENNYASDNSKRILFGQSLGGQFALYNAVMGTDLFMGLIASNPAIHRNVEFFLKSYSQNKHPVKLFISRAQLDEKRFIKPMDKWLTHWQNKSPWVLKIQQVDNHNHFSAAPDAFRNGLIWILQN